MHARKNTCLHTTRLPIQPLASYMCSLLLSRARLELLTLGQAEHGHSQGRSPLCLPPLLGV